ncbi:MAG: tetratricopeptide repeat protein [Sandaracinus sp.]
MAEVNDAIRPTLLMVGRGEAMDAALKVALDRHGLRVAESSAEVKTAVRTIAPDVVLLVGDAAADGGRVVLDALATDAVTNVVPVIVLGPAEKLDGRLTAFRAGAVAVVPRTASADQIATRIAVVAREIAERGEARPDELGEATFDELVTMVASELRSGILSVGRQRGGQSNEAMRIVLGAGRPVADAVEEFVRKLRPLVSRAEPLTYELHASAGGPVGLLDAEPAGRGDLSILQGLRVILVDSDASRADTLAQELRSRGAVVAVADPSARGIERARGLDPQVVIVDAAGMDGEGFEVVRAIRRDLRLRWAAMLVAPWAEIWPENAATPDLAELALRLMPLVVHDRELRVRATAEAKFDARLEVIGPSRMLRVLASLPGPFHVHVQSRKASVEIDVAEGLIVGAKATRAAGDGLEGTRALAALLAMASARVSIERRPNPATANVMAPVEEALARASQEVAPIPVSQPPPPPSATSKPGKRSPFPTASEVTRVVLDDDGDSSGPLRPPIAPRTRANQPSSHASSRDLRWGESEHGAGPPPATSAGEAAASPSQVGAVPQGVFSGTGASAPKMPAVLGKSPTRTGAAASAFGDAKPTDRYDLPVPSAARGGEGDKLDKPFFPAVTPAAPPRRDDATVRVHGEDLARARDGAPSVPLPSKLEPKKSSSPGFPAAPAARVELPLGTKGSSPGFVGAPSAKAPVPARTGLPLGMVSSSPGTASSPAPAASAQSSSPGGVEPPALVAAPPTLVPTPEPSPAASPAGPRPPGRKQTLVMGALQGIARPAPVMPTPPVPVPSSAIVPRSPTVTMGSVEGEAPHSAPPPPEPSAAPSPITTMSASLEDEASDDPLFADGKSKLASGEHESEPPSAPAPAPALTTGEHTSPSTRPFVPDGEAMKEPVGAPPVPDTALIAPPTPRARPKVEAPPPSAEPPPAMDEHAPVGSLAMSLPPAAPTPVLTPSRSDATPLGVISMPAPPSGVPTGSNRPPAAPAGGTGRGIAWVLVGLGVLALLGAAAFVAYQRQDELRALLGGEGSTVVAVALDAGAVPSIEIDAGTATALGAGTGSAPEAAVDAGVAPSDAWVEAPDAWAAPAEDAAVVAEPDAWAAEEVAEATPSEGTSALDLVEQASHAPPEQAETLLRRALTVDPREHHAALALAELLMHRHAPAEAVPLYELVVRRRPGRAEYRVDLGDARRDAGDAEGARAAWREALEIDPDNADAHERLGQ